MSILTVESMAQAAADYSGIEQTIYQRNNGALVFCAKGNKAGFFMTLQRDESITYIKTIRPSYWPKEA